MQTNKLMLMGLVMLCTGCKLWKKKTPPAAPAAIVKPAETPKKGPKPYKEVITDKTKTYSGLFKIHQLEDRYLFEIPDSLLGREILLANRIRKAPANSNGIYGGDAVNDLVIRFEKGPNGKLFVRQITFKSRALDSTDNGMSRAIDNSNTQALVTAFEIKTLAKDSISGYNATVIDITDYLNEDENIFSFSKKNKSTMSIGPLAKDRSYISAIKAYPTNVEIRMVKTYNIKDEWSTFELNSSLVLLPKDVMRSRRADARVGYFTNRFVDFDANPQGIKSQQLVTRWRLEPKPEDRERYLRGELVEPQKPIIFYIDPATPKKWRSYLIQGINDWQVAFEQAGFKNAIIGREAPQDSSWSLDDARHSAIVYKASDIANASGPHISDPRSGEILESHINWYHNIMEILHDWYFIQVGAVDPRARSMQFDDKLMGQLIRFVSSHEVGHTLGLRHNFGSSATVSVEKLRDRQWLDLNGHTPSIMDYARFNYVAQPEDNIGPNGLFPRIGDYDKWAIEWGYRWWPEFPTAQEEAAYSNKMIIDRLSNNQRLIFGTESDDFDPRNQSEALGDNAMLASMYGIKNLQRILPNILNWTRQPDEGYEAAANMYANVVGQYGRYMGHVTKNVGGMYTTPRAIEEKGVVYQPVPKAIQQEAVAFLNKQLFTTPTWLINKDLIERAGVRPQNDILGIQKKSLNRLLNSKLIEKLINDETTYGSSAYTAQNLLGDLKAGIWSELRTKKSMNISRRNLQRNYVDNMCDLLNEKNKPISSNQFEALIEALTASSAPKTTDISSITRVHLNGLAKDIRSTIPVSKGIDKSHLENMLLQINNALEGKITASLLEKK